MVKKLRYKFVAVTMTLMVTVFGIFFLADYLYNRYWNDLDILDTLEWFADAGVFRNETMVGDTDMDLDETNGYSVYFVLLDRSGKVVKTAGTSAKAYPSRYGRHSAIIRLRCGNGVPISIPYAIMKTGKRASI